MNTAIILAGGTGTRLGSSIPKQYIEVDGRPIIFHCLQTFAMHPKIDAIQIVADAMWRDYIAGWIGRIEKPHECRYGFSAPGKNRQESIFNALEDVKAYVAADDFVIVHDAARPFLMGAFISKCLAAAEGHDGVMPVLPMKDTVYFSKDGVVIDSLLDRNCVFAGQAPEVFVFGKYYEANRALLPEQIYSINGSTEPAVLAGMDMAIIPGDENNFKITTQMDLERFNRIMEKRSNVKEE